VAQGHLDEADRWALEFSPLLGGEGQTTLPYVVIELMNLALTRLWLAQGQPALALDVSERQAQAAEQRGRMGVVIEWLALQALAHAALGNTSQAMATLERALSRAEPEGYVRVFVDEGEPMKLLIADFRLRIERRERGEPERLNAYVNKLLTAFPDERRRTKGESAGLASVVLGPAKRSLVESLSEREIEVLRLIADGLSNQEIADRLVVALSTVKTHVNNLYSKLGVTNRVQAVSRAQELNLLHTPHRSRVSWAWRFTRTSDNSSKADSSHGFLCN